MGGWAVQEQHCCSQVASAVVSAAHCKTRLKLIVKLYREYFSVHGNSLKSFYIILSNILICNATFRQLPQMTITIIWLFSSVPALVGWLVGFAWLGWSTENSIKIAPRAPYTLIIFLGWLLVNVLLVLFSLPRAISRCRHFDFLSHRRRLFCRLCTCLRDNKTNNCNG